MINYTITSPGVIPANLHLTDSCQVSKRKFQSTLNDIRALHPKSEVWKRSDCGMKLEWATHNALYALHILRSHTKDVDLNYPQKWYEKIGYAVAGTIVWPFIK